MPQLYQIMDLWIIVLIVTITVPLLGYYWLSLKLKNLMSRYQKQFSQHFKVFCYPIMPLSASEFDFCQKSNKDSNDFYKHTKEVLSTYDIGISNIGPQIQLILINPKLMQAFYQLDQERYYRKLEATVVGLRRMVGTGITFSTGDLWKMKRRVTTKMLNFTYIKSLVPKIEEIALDKASKAFPESQNHCSEHVMLDITTTIASSVVSQLFFGGGKDNAGQLMYKDRPVNEYIREMMGMIFKQMIDPAFVMLGPKFADLGLTKFDRRLNSLVHDFRTFTKNFVSERLQQLEGKYKDNDQKFPEVYTDIIEAFYVEEIQKKKGKVTDEFVQSIVDDFGTLYTAGTDTTSRNTLMAIYYIFRDKNLTAQLIKEIGEHQKPNEPLNYEHLKSLTKLQAAVMETQRVYASANGIFPREAKQDHVLKVGDHTYPIRKGTIVNPQNMPAQHSINNYEEPHTFKPDRFLDKEGKISHPESFTYMNFSAGTRSCIGKQLAMTEMKTILVALLNHYQVSVNDQKMEMEFRELAYGPKNVEFEVRKI